MTIQFKYRGDDEKEKTINCEPVRLNEIKNLGPPDYGKLTVKVKNDRMLVVVAKIESVTYEDTGEAVSEPVFLSVMQNNR